MPDEIVQGKDTIAIRIPDDEWIIGLINDLGKPLMVTSANISAQGSLLKWQDVCASMNGRIDGIVCEDAHGAEASTIIDVSGDEIILLRQGPIELARIMEVIE